MVIIMKLTRRIRRSWLKVIAEWMKCFARSVNRVCNCCKRLAVSNWQRSKSTIRAGIASLKNGVRIHTKEWAAAALAAGLIVAPYAAGAAPQGGVVVGGDATIAQHGVVTNIAQTSQRAAIDWTSFDIAKNETVNFVQPSASAVALNNILGSNASQIYGHLNANGQVYLVNPNGILFAPGSEINVAGLVATTSHVDPLKFMREGTIDTTQRNAAINVGGSIFAAGGLVTIAGATAINQSEIIRATTLNGDGGRITINNATSINVSGVIDASATNNSPSLGNGGTISIIADIDSGMTDVAGATLLAKGGALGGDGGFVETSAAKVKGLDTVSVNTSSPLGKTGTFKIDPPDFYICDGGGDMSPATIETLLSTNNLTIFSQQGTQFTNGWGNIHVWGNISWTGSNALTLSAYNNVYMGAVTEYPGPAAEINHVGNGDLIIVCNNQAQCSDTQFQSECHSFEPIYSHINMDQGAVYIYQDQLNYDGFINIQGYVVQFYNINTVGDYMGISPNSLSWLANGQYGMGFNYYLNANLDAGQTRDWVNGLVTIGSKYDPFTGIFTGLRMHSPAGTNGNTITNLYINGSTHENIGLFGNVAGAEICDFSLINPVYTINPNNNQSNYIGGIAGHVTNSAIRNVTVVSPVINASHVASSSDFMVGGVVGYASGCTFDNVTVVSLNLCTINSGKSVSMATGGIAGYVTNSVLENVSGLFLDVSVLQNGDIGNVYAGGAVGYAESSTLNNLFLLTPSLSVADSNTYAMGDDGIFIGGVAGELAGSGLISGSIMNNVSISSSSSNVYELAGPTLKACAGGIAGRLDSSGTIANCSMWNANISGCSPATLSGVSIGNPDAVSGNYREYPAGTSGNELVDNYVGGIAGLNCGTILDSHVFGGQFTGIGVNYEKLALGGVAGENSGGTVNASTVYNVALSGSSVQQGLCTLNFGGVVGRNTGGGTVGGSDTRLVLSANDTNDEIVMNYTSGGDIVISGTILPGDYFATATVTQVSESSLTLANMNISSDLFVTASNNFIVSGYASADNIDVVAGGNITLATGTIIFGNSIVLASISGNFYNLAGSSALIGPLWLVYSQNPDDDSRNGLFYSFKQYNAVHGTTVLGQRSGFLYSAAPTISNIYLGGQVVKTYDGTAVVPGGALFYISASGYSGNIDSSYPDTISSLGLTSANYDNANVSGSPHKLVTADITAANITMKDRTDAIVYGYAFSQSTASGVIGLIVPPSQADTARQAAMNSANRARNNTWDNVNQKQTGAGQAPANDGAAGELQGLPGSLVTVDHSTGGTGVLTTAALVSPGVPDINSPLLTRAADDNDDPDGYGQN